MKTAKFNKSIYKNLSEIEMFIVDRYVEKNRVYIIESVETEKNIDYLFLEGLTNVGVNASWFNVH